MFADTEAEYTEATSENAASVLAKDSSTTESAIMVKVTTQDYYLDGYLKDNLDRAKTAIEQDYDMVFLIDGSEGSGKSVMAMQMAYYCDNSLTLSRVTFTPGEFKSAILKAEPKSAVIYDEAYTGLSSRAAMSLINRTLISMLAEIRQKNLFVFVVMPTFFDLDKYVALWRSKALIHIYTDENFSRGYFNFYNSERKKDLFINGKKFYNYMNPKPNFYGRFTNHYVIDMHSYKVKKHNSLMKKELNNKADNDLEIIRKYLMPLFKKLGDKITVDIKSELLGVSKATYYNKLKEFEALEVPNEDSLA